MPRTPNGFAASVVCEVRRSGSRRPRPGRTTPPRLGAAVSAAIRPEIASPSARQSAKRCSIMPRRMPRRRCPGCTPTQVSQPLETSAPGDGIGARERNARARRGGCREPPGRGIRSWHLRARRPDPGSARTPHAGDGGEPPIAACGPGKAGAAIGGVQGGRAAGVGPPACSRGSMCGAPGERRGAPPTHAERRRDARAMAPAANSESPSSRNGITPVPPVAAS